MVLARGGYGKKVTKRRSGKATKKEKSKAVFLLPYLLHLLFDIHIQFTCCAGD
jgi:hypothetical protein